MNFSFPLGKDVQDVILLPFLFPVKIQTPLQKVPLTEKGMKLEAEAQGREELGRMSSDRERPQPEAGSGWGDGDPLYLLGDLAPPPRVPRSLLQKGEVGTGQAGGTPLARGSADSSLGLGWIGV